MHLFKSIYFILSVVLSLLGIGCAYGGDTISYEQMGGIYYTYHYDSTQVETPAPEGYRPFYISHFGRHGSRWLPSDERYLRVLEQFADTAALTSLGKDVRQRLLLVWEDAKGRGGDLTPLGAKQQRDIAGRMYARWHEVFQGNASISARSSVVGRCIMSMNAFLLRLQALNPQLDITAESHKRFMPYIAYSSPQEDSLIANTPRVINISPDRLMSSLFVDPSGVKSPMDLLSELHCIASDMQNTECGVSLYDIFTPAELRAVYDASNLNMWTCNTCNDISGDIPAKSAESLWHNIVESADEAIAQGNVAATLRFGHDTSLYRLFTLLGLMQDERRMDCIIPMAANLIMVFYRNASNHVIVKFMHNEREIELPIDSESRPYYDWEKVKSLSCNRYLHNRNTHVMRW